MIPKTDIEKQLIKYIRKRITSEEILKEVQTIFSENELERVKIAQKLREKTQSTASPLNVNLLKAERIFHIQDIKSLCVDYRLRFLDAHFFKGPFPEEAITKIRDLEKEHQTTLKGFKVVAPSKLLKLENADDPLLFVPLGHDYFYLVHKWGNDLHPLRKLLMWPYKSFENLVFSVFILSILLTALIPMQAFTKGEVSEQEYLLMFLFMFKAVGGIVLFYGFSKGKNFNKAIWDSKYYNA